MPNPQIMPVANNAEKKETYREQMGRHSKAMKYRFYLEAIMIDYATMEDRLRSVLYHVAFLSNRKSRNSWNKTNSNNFVLHTRRGQDVENMPADLCNAVAPLYDSGDLTFVSASVSYVEPISKRSRYAKQAMLFVELRAKLTGENLL